jgi:hypothetical protein
METPARWPGFLFARLNFFTPDLQELKVFALPSANLLQYKRQVP